MNNPSPGRTRNSERVGLWAISLAALLCFATAADAKTNRLILDPNSRHGDPISGRTELLVAIPYEAARVTLSIDGREIGTRTTPPYSFEIDFGPRPLEHRLTVTATDRRSGKKMHWTEIVNQGFKPLSIELRQEGAAAEALVSFSPDDPVQEVSFFDGDRNIAKLSAPPYRVDVSPSSGVLLATAKSRSGAEVAATLTARGDVLMESFDVRTVPLLITVVDQNGSARADLAASSFKIYDKGREAKVLEFARALEQPVSLALVLDASSSMALRMHEATAAATRFVESMMRGDDRFAVFTVRTVPRREQALTADPATVKDALHTLKAGGDTALFDSIATAIRDLNSLKGRRAIVVLTDGADTSSNRTFEELVHEAKQAAIPVYVIDYSEGRDQRNIDQMRYLATETGGFVATSDTSLDRKYKAIETDLRAQYLIRYQISDSGTPGEWRPVKVVVNSPRLSARTIRGYFTP